MRSSNPVFNSIERSEVFSSTENATYAGISLKTTLMLLIAVLTGFLTINYAGDGAIPLMFVSMFVALIAVIVGSRSPRLAKPFAIVYAAAEGVLLGVITYIIDVKFQGVAVTALIGTASIFTVMLFLYSSRTIRVTPRFTKIMYSILLGMLLFFVTMMLISLFSNQTIELPSSVELLISGFIILFGAFMLTIHFDRAESIVNGGFGKEYEWMVALGLMVTIVWIYLELLRFLAIIASNRR